MKRLIVAALLLLAVLGATAANSRYLTGMTDDLCQQLSRAANFASKDNWPRALELTEQTLANWEEHDFYLHSLLRHMDIDSIRMTFHEVVEYLLLAEPDQYTAANARLITQLKLLAEAEQLNLKNIL